MFPFNFNTVCVIIGHQKKGEREGPAMAGGGGGGSWRERFSFIYLRWGSYHTQKNIDCMYK